MSAKDDYHNNVLVDIGNVVSAFGKAIINIPEIGVAVDGLPVAELARAGKVPDLATLGNDIITTREEFRDALKLKQTSKGKQPLKLRQVVTKFETVSLEDTSRLGKAAKAKNLVVLAPDSRARNLANLIPAAGDGSSTFASRMMNTGREYLKRLASNKQMESINLMDSLQARNMTHIMEASPNTKTALEALQMTHPSVPVERTVKGKGGAVVPVERLSKQKRFWSKIGKSIPFIGASFDVAAAAEDFAKGDTSGGLGHLGDALVGATVVGELLNIGAIVATGGEADGIISVAFEAAEDLGGTVV